MEQKHLMRGVGVAVSIGGQSSDIRKRKLVNPVVQKTYSIIAVVLACVFLYFVWANDNDSANTIRQLKDANARLENRLTTAQGINESQHQRLEYLQGEIDNLRQEIARDVVTVTTITERESGNQEIIERSLARVAKLQSLIDEIGKGN